MNLKNAYLESKNSEKHFANKKILFIGSEGYDAATVTTIQGLDELGFKIYTINKTNINSWFCNIVINDPNKYKFDFILSNLHWGTRWSYFEKYKLNNYLKILIDGDDNTKNFPNWKYKYCRYKNRYVNNPDENIKMKKLSDCRWIEDLNKYKPDILFTTQRTNIKEQGYYLPFGIAKEYINTKINSLEKRPYDFVNIDGPGEKRKRMKKFLNFNSLLHLIPGKIFNGYVKGEIEYPEKIKEIAKKDKNIHGYNRWGISKNYFQMLNNAKILIYPGIVDGGIWESKRPWESYANGCLVLMSKPNINCSDYPITELCSFAVYNSYYELTSKARFLYKNKETLDKYRLQATEDAHKYFTPKPIGNYFLKKIKDSI